MSCEEELNALQRAEQELARFRKLHPVRGGPQPTPDPGPRPVPPRPDPIPVPNPDPLPNPPMPDPIPTPTPVPPPNPSPDPIPDPGPNPDPIPDPGPEPQPSPVGGSGEAALSDAEVLHRTAELTTAVMERQAAYERCRGQGGGGYDIESLMRDATGRPLGGGAGPPM
ncbi:MAG: hypothetical protein HOW97_31875 [Catenulispora sp.]|nr:hypothetical protein [Catenulispora sp.]